MRTLSAARGELQCTRVIKDRHLGAFVTAAFLMPRCLIHRMKSSKPGTGFSTDAARHGIIKRESACYRFDACR